MKTVSDVVQELHDDTVITGKQLKAILEALMLSNDDAIGTAPRKSLPKPQGPAPITPSTWDAEDQLTPATVAAWLKESEETLSYWRKNSGAGPEFTRHGKNVTYRVKDVKDWLAARRVKNTTEAHLKGLSRLEEAFPLFTYADGLKLDLEASIAHTQANPEVDPVSYEIIRMSSAMDDDFDLFKALPDDLPAAEKILSSGLKDFDLPSWLLIKFSFGKVHSPTAYMQAIGLLVEHGHDINKGNAINGYTLAHVIGKFQDGFDEPSYYTEFVLHLLDLGLVLKQQDNNFMTALDYALEDYEEADSPLWTIFKRWNFAEYLEHSLKK